MKKTILTLCSAITALCLSGYDIVYTYDAAGNRIRRGPYTEVVQQAMRSVPDRVGTESMLGDVRVMYSPNPTKGILHVTVNTDGRNVGAIQLYSLSGLLLQQTAGLNNTDFDLSGQQPGVYLLLVDVNGENQVYKIVKE